jgi:DNA-binding transcriptional regulator WhiA
MEKFRTIIWDELINLPTSEPCAELLGFLDALPRSESRGAVSFLCPRPVIGRRLLKLWKNLNEISFSAKIMPSNMSFEMDRKQGRASFLLTPDILREITGGSALRNGSERWAWFRGLWGGCGALYLPQSGYYMTFRPQGAASGERAKAILNSAGTPPAVREKRGRAEYTLRDQEQIVTCLSKMGLVKSSLILEETAIVRSIRNRVNKVINCDSANIRKTVEAARNQLALVDRIDAEGLWDLLTPVQAELASKRRLNPSASLSELGQLMSRPVSKSTVEYRWRKLDSILKSKG